MHSDIRVEADDYYNAYRILNESNDLLMERLENRQGKPIIAKKVYGSYPTFSPSIVCLAFALELYIKDLHFVLTDEVPRGHNILKLFEKLPKEVKEEIFDNDLIKGNPFFTRGSILSVNQFSKAYTAYDGFIDNLKTISDAFVQWRYSFERGAVNYDTSLAIALAQSIIEISDRERKNLLDRKKSNK